MKIEPSADCGNSPKNQFVQDVAIALLARQIPDGMLSDDIKFEFGVGEESSGQNRLVELLASNPLPVSLKIDHAFAHGKAGAASGTAIWPDEEVTRFAFFMEFTSASAKKVSRIASYV